MILAFRRPCTDHRAALLDWIDRRASSAGTAAALAHLDRCRSCERELTDVALVIAGLRRLERDVAEAEPSPEAWLRLRARVTRRVDPWQWRTTLGGLATSALLVAVLVMPVTIGSPATLDNGLEVTDSPAALRAESAYLASIRVGDLPPTPRVERGAGGVPINLPPEIEQVRKEVTTSAAAVNPRTPKPI